MIHAAFKRSNLWKSIPSINVKKGNGGNCRAQQKKPRNLPNKGKVSQLQNTKAKEPGEEDSDRNDRYHKELEKVNQMAVGLGIGLLHNAQSKNKNSFLSYSLNFYI